MGIIAMDLGKNNTVVCHYEAGSGMHEFSKIRTTRQAIHDLLVKHNPDRVVFEICSSAGWVYDICCALKIETQVANVNHQAWRWKNVKRKNDRLDALRLAQLSAMNQLPTVHVSKRQVRQKRSLIHYRQRLVKRRTQIKNNIRALLEKEGMSLRGGKNGWSKASIEQLKTMSLSIEECLFEDLWKGQLHLELMSLEHLNKLIAEVESKLDELASDNKSIKILRSVSGIGPRLAETIAAFIDEPHRFKNGKQVGSYAGLTPRQYQSGNMDRQGKISGQGNKLLRSMLVEVSWLGLRHNKWMNETYHRILRGSESRKKIAITAVARKLLVRCWAMLRDESCWKDNLRRAA